MATWDREAAIACARQNVHGHELYAWLPQYETDDEFAFLVLFEGHIKRG